MADGGFEEAPAAPAVNPPGNGAAAADKGPRKDTHGKEASRGGINPYVGGMMLQAQYLLSRPNSPEGKAYRAMCLANAWVGHYLAPALNRLSGHLAFGRKSRVASTGMHGMGSFFVLCCFVWCCVVRMCVAYSSVHPCLIFECYCLMLWVHAQGASRLTALGPSSGGKTKWRTLSRCLVIAPARCCTMWRGRPFATLT